MGEGQGPPYLHEQDLEGKGRKKTMDGRITDPHLHADLAALFLFLRRATARKSSLTRPGRRPGRTGASVAAASAGTHKRRMRASRLLSSRSTRHYVTPSHCGACPSPRWQGMRQCRCCSTLRSITMTSANGVAMSRASMRCAHKTRSLAYATRTSLAASVRPCCRRRSASLAQLLSACQLGQEQARGKRLLTLGPSGGCPRRLALRTGPSTLRVIM